VINVSDIFTQKIEKKVSLNDRKRWAWSGKFGFWPFVIFSSKQNYIFSKAVIYKRQTI